MRKGGNVSIIGVYGPPWNLMPIGTAMNKGLTLRMNQCNVRATCRTCWSTSAQGRIDAKGIITHRFPLEEAPQAYHLFAQKQDDCIKCVLVPARRTPDERRRPCRTNRIVGRGVDADPTDAAGHSHGDEAASLVPGAQMPIEPQKLGLPGVDARREAEDAAGVRDGRASQGPERAASGRWPTGYPDHWARHWMMLMMADRVDSWEHNLRRVLPLAAVVFAGGLTVKLLRR